MWIRWDISNLLKGNDMEEEKKSGGFWKGFFTAAILFIMIAVVCIAVVWGIRMKVSQNNASHDTVATSNSLTTQSREVQLKLGLLESYIRGYYLEEVNEEDLEDYLYYGLVAGLGDPYAAYYNEEETQSMLDSSSGSYCGIGAMFSQNMITGVVTVSRVYEGFPSYEAGILPEDILIKVEGEEITGTAAAHLNIVSNQQNIMTVTKITQALEPLDRQNMDSAISLDSLDNNRSRFFHAGMVVCKQPFHIRDRIQLREHIGGRDVRYIVQRLSCAFA